MSIVPMATTPVCLKCHKEFPRRDLTISGPSDWCLSCCKERLRTLPPMWPPEHFVPLDEQAGIPQRYRVFNDTPAYRQAQVWFNEALELQQPLYLHGPVETGKTLTLSLLSSFLIRHMGNVCFIQCADFADQLRREQDKQAYWWKRCTECSHLVLDDLGSQYDGTGWFAGWLDSIVNYRYSNLKAVSASTNCPEKISARVTRRLLETCKVVEIKR